MFKDDRFISILSGVVLMVAIGTVVQRGGPLVEYFRGGPEGPVLVRDRADATAGELTAVDVLANDREFTERDRARLEIVSPPECGKAFIQDSRIHYVPEEVCSGEQVVVYGLGRTDGPTGELILAIAPPEIDTTVPVPEPEIARAPEGLTPGGLRDGATDEDEAPETADAPTPDADDSAVALAPTTEDSSPADTAPAAINLDLDADPVRPRLPGAAPRPLDLADVDDSPLQLGVAATDTSPVAGTAGPTELGSDLIDSTALARTEVAQPAQPNTASTRAPDALRTGVDDSRNNDFASAASRGGLLARPARASTTAAPAPTVLAQIRESDALPTIGDVASGWQPGALASVAPADAGVSIDSGVTAEDTTRRADVGGLAPPSGDAGPGRAIGELAALPSGPEPNRAEPAALRFGAAIGDRVSQLSPPPSPGGLGPNRFDPAAPQPSASISIARVDRSVGAFNSPSAPTIGRGPDTLAGPAENGVSRSATPPTGFQDQSRVALAAPASGLGEVRDLGNALTIVPVDTTAAPSGLAAPKPADESVTLAALPPGFDPDAPAVAPANDPAAGTTEEDEGTEVAALPAADAACTIPPGITIDPRGGAFTQVIVKSPCHKGQVITLSYSGLEFALQVDQTGVAQVLAPGFQPRSKANLAMPDGESLDLDIPFGDTDRIIRVALVWDTGVSLELHALANGRNIGSEGHIRPDNPGSLRKARRGGGFLTTYHDIDGIGQSLQVYTHVPRRGQPEIVKLMIDFASRRRATTEETCGDGALATPSFRVVRSNRGQMERVLTRRLSAVACDEVRTTGAKLIEQAVEDVVISSR